MKKIVALVLSVMLMLACNPANEKGNSVEPVAAENHHQPGEKAGEPGLNNGSKWKVDLATFSKVGFLKTILSGPGKESLESYSKTAAELESGLNKMIAECKMKGADHEALHHWLEPLLKNTKELKEATSFENASVIFHEIQMQVNLFDQYFELS